MVVSFEGTTYTEAYATGSLVSESRTVVRISLIRPWRILSLRMMTCAFALTHKHTVRTMREINFFIL